MLSMLNRFETQGWERKVYATGPGSARPVVSKMTLSCLVPARLACVTSSCSAVMMSLRKEQQTQPPEMVTRSSVDRSWFDTAGQWQVISRRVTNVRSTRYPTALHWELRAV
jgi:hypothetical protein